MCDVLFLDKLHFYPLWTGRSITDRVNSNFERALRRPFLVDFHQTHRFFSWSIWAYCVFVNRTRFSRKAAVQSLMTHWLRNRSKTAAASQSAVTPCQLIMANKEYKSWWGGNGLSTHETMNCVAASHTKKDFILPWRADSMVLGAFCHVSSTSFSAAHIWRWCTLRGHSQRCVYHRDSSFSSWDITLWSQGATFKLWRTTLTVQRGLIWFVHYMSTCLYFHGDLRLVLSRCSWPSPRALARADYANQDWFPCIARRRHRSIEC